MLQKLQQLALQLPLHCAQVPKCLVEVEACISNSSCGTCVGKWLQVPCTTSHSPVGEHRVPSWIASDTDRPQGPYCEPGVCHSGAIFASQWTKLVVFQ